jgi:hypothetical protein
MSQAKRGGEQDRLARGNGETQEGGKAGKKRKGRSITTT